jgi:hypothetical protein
MCPSVEDLRRFLNEELDEAHRAAIEGHLQDCARCFEALEAMGDAGTEGIAEALDCLSFIPPSPRFPAPQAGSTDRTADVLWTVAEGPGTRIGPYKLLQKTTPRITIQDVNDWNLGKATEEIRLAIEADLDDEDSRVREYLEWMGGVPGRPIPRLVQDHYDSMPPDVRTALANLSFDDDDFVAIDSADAASSRVEAGRQVSSARAVGAPAWSTPAPSPNGDDRASQWHPSDRSLAGPPQRRRAHWPAIAAAAVLLLAAGPLLLRILRSPDQVEFLGADARLMWGMRNRADGELEPVKEAPPGGGSGEGHYYRTTGDRPLWISISTPRDGVARVIRVLPGGWELLRGEVPVTARKNAKSLNAHDSSANSYGPIKAPSTEAVLLVVVTGFPAESSLRDSLPKQGGLEQVEAWEERVRDRLRKGGHRWVSIERITILPMPRSNAVGATIE